MKNLSVSLVLTAIAWPFLGVAGASRVDGPEHSRAGVEGNQGQVLDVVRARKFQLVNEDGECLAELISTDHDTAIFQFYKLRVDTAGGKRPVEIIRLGSVFPNHPELVITDSWRSASVSLGVWGQPSRPLLQLRSEPEQTAYSWNAKTGKLVKRD